MLEWEVPADVDVRGPAAKGCIALLKPFPERSSERAAFNKTPREQVDVSGLAAKGHRRLTLPNPCSKKVQDAALKQGRAWRR